MLCIEGLGGVQSKAIQKETPEVKTPGRTQTQQNRNQNGLNKAEPFTVVHFKTKMSKRMFHRGDNGVEVLPKRSRKHNRNPMGFKKRAEEAKIAKVVQRVVARKAETKHWDTGATINVGAATIADLSLVPQGDSGEERVGQKIQPRYFGIRWYIRGNASATIQSRCRIIVFQWPDDGSPTGADILEDATNPWSYYRMGPNMKFNILYDTRAVSSNQNQSGEFIIQGEANIPAWKIRPIGFAETLTTGPHHIWILHLSDSALNYPVLQYNTRLAYTNM